MSNDEREIQVWPQLGGPAALSTVSGPRKKLPQQFKRVLWERDVPQPDPNCSICKDLENVVLSRHDDDAEMWVVLNSITAPEEPHRLITPRSCQSWTREKVRIMGGEAKIRMAIRLALATSALRNDQFSVQIGGNAAQTMAHAPLYHLYRDVWETQVDADWVNELKGLTSDTLIFEADGLEIRAGGHRTGELLFLPADTKSPPPFNEDFATVVYRLVTLNTRAFTSTTGLPPDLSFEICIQDGKIQFGVFVPILNPWGTMEYMAFFMPRKKGVNVMWHPRQTAEALKAAM